jgi:hypothetical protein
MRPEASSGALAAYGDYRATFNPICLNHGSGTTNTQTYNVTGGVRTFTADFSCSFGERTKSNETANLTCNP